jgi:hypothetical protein
MERPKDDEQNDSQQQTIDALKHILDSMGFQETPEMTDIKRKLLAKPNMPFEEMSTLLTLFKDQAEALSDQQTNAVARTKIQVGENIWRGMVLLSMGQTVFCIDEMNDALSLASEMGSQDIVQQLEQVLDVIG